MAAMVGNKRFHKPFHFYAYTVFSLQLYFPLFWMRDFLSISPVIILAPLINAFSNLLFMLKLRSHLRRIIPEHLFITSGFS